MAFLTCANTIHREGQLTTGGTVRESLSLHIFQSHLPDPNQDLFIEQWRNTQTFHGFARLPDELQVMIWHQTFRPGQTEKLNPMFPLVENPLWQRKPLPISLFVNAKSRAEALRHFCIFFHESLPESPKFQKKPLCFRPATDILLLDFHFFYKENQERFYGGHEKHRSLKQLISDLCDGHPRHMRKVEHIELNMMHMRPRAPDLLATFDEDGPYGEPPRKGPSFYTGFLFQFPGLKEITQHHCLCDESRQVAHIATALKTYLKKNRHRFLHGRAPEISVKASRIYSPS